MPTTKRISIYKTKAETNYSATNRWVSAILLDSSVPLRDGELSPYGLKTKEHIFQQLKEIASQEAPPSTMGAMCYSMPAPPDVAEYVCPACGEKTFYSKRHAIFVDWKISACRRVFQELQKFTDICSLDESSYCANCCPDATDYYLKLTVTYPDGSSLVSSHVTLNQLCILSNFFQGHLSYTDSYDGSTPLKSELYTLYNLLIEKIDTADYEYDMFLQEKSGERVLIGLAQKTSCKHHKIAVLLGNMRDKILQDSHMLTDAGNETVATNEPNPNICDQSSTGRKQKLILSLSESERNELQEIDSTLLRIINGDYGRCKYCGKEIPLSRLKALLFTQYCVKCQSIVENIKSKTSNE